MTALAICQEVARRVGVPVPSGVFSTQNQTALQLGSLLNAVMEDLSERWNWGESTREAIITIVSGTDQGSVDTVIGGGYKSLVLDSGWNRSRNIRLYGPVNAVGWAAQRSLPARGIGDSFRVVGGKLHIDSPQTQVGDTVAFEYFSSHVVVKAAGGFSQVYTADGDWSLLPDAVVKAGLIAEWKYAKGLSYAEEKRRYELMAGSAASRSGSAGIKFLDQGPEHAVAGGILL